MRTERLMIAASGLTIALCGAVWAGVPGAPGWQWGGANCGCSAPVPSGGVVECRNCCAAGGLPAVDVPSCISFCLQAQWPCEPPCPWYYFGFC